MTACKPSNVSVRYCHVNATAGHIGFAKNNFRVHANYIWMGMHPTISKYAQSCHQCQSRKCAMLKPSAAHRPFFTPDRPFQSVRIDCLRRFLVPASNYRWVLVAVDHMTHYAEAERVPEAAA